MADFIPARESRLFIRLFRVYVRWLFRRRFEQVWLKEEYRRGPEARTVYYLNHHSWWDGLIPFLLNEYRFRQQARALMGDRQMRRYPFFSRIGAFSVNRSDPRSTLRSLRYAVDSMRRPNASLFIYPEGTLTAPETPVAFEEGLAWLHGRLGPDGSNAGKSSGNPGSKFEAVDFVPVAVHIHTLRHARPELHLWVGEPVRPPSGVSSERKTAAFEEALEELLGRLRKTAGFDDSPFSRFV